MTREFAFNFPRSRFASSAGYTRRGQADQITQEAAEVFSAAERGDGDAYVEELLDCIHACETALSEFDGETIAAARDAVVRKNAARGYYSGDAEADLVDHPAHYEHGGRQSIEIVEKVIDGLPASKAFSLGCALKYVLRAGYKDDLETDLEKANNFAHRACTGKWRWERE